MVDERRAGEDPTEPEPEPERQPERGWERRSGEDRRKAERRTIEVPVDKDRRSGWDRRQRDRRK